MSAKRPFVIPLYHCVDPHSGEIGSETLLAQTIVDAGRKFEEALNRKHKKVSFEGRSAEIGTFVGNPYDGRPCVTLSLIDGEVTMQLVKFDGPNFALRWQIPYLSREVQIKGKTIEEFAFVPGGMKEGTDQQWHVYFFDGYQRGFLNGKLTIIKANQVKGVNANVPNEALYDWIKKGQINEEQAGIPLAKLEKLLGIVQPQTASTIQGS